MSSHVVRPVVAAVDASIGNPAVIDVAAAEADLRGLPLRLVGVRGREYVIVSARAAPGTAVLSASQARQRVLESYPGLAVTTTQTRDDPASAVIREAHRATLVVLGQQPRPVSGRSMAAEVAARADCPVIITPTGERDVPAMSRRPIVVAVKARDRDAAAVSFGLQQAARHHAPVRVVHVWVNIPDMEYASVDPFVYDLAEAGRDAEELIEEAIDGRDERYPQVSVQRVPLYRVDVAETLVDASADASLLVLGPPRFDRSGAAALGPVTEAVMDHAGCPVAVAHQGSPQAPPDLPVTRRVHSVLEMLHV